MKSWKAFSQAEALQTANEKDIQPLLYYQDSTSEDEQIEDELIPYLLRIFSLLFRKLLNINVIKRSHSEFEDYVFSDEEDDEE